MDASTLRAWWAHKQGLDGSLRGATAAAVLERSGWARSVAGVGPYLTLFSRARVGRADADAAVSALSIHELPAARNCTYVVPASDFAFALRCGREASLLPMKTAVKLGVTEKEIDALRVAVLAALKSGPLDPDGIRSATGDASRNLGPEGVKKGLTTTLPLALGLLQSTGEIRRVPVNGRLDQQRYKYTLWNLPPVSMTEEQVGVELARRFFRWTGPASLAEFQWFSGLGVKTSKAAVEPLGLVALEDGRLLFAEDLDALRAFQPPKKRQIELVASIDALMLLRRDMASLIEEEERGRPVFGEKGPVAGGSLAELPNHAIVDRGRIVGVWEYDTATESIAWAAFGGRTKALEMAVAETGAYVREQLGDARSFSLDSPKSRAPKIAALRVASAG